MGDKRFSSQSILSKYSVVETIDEQGKESDISDNEHDGRLTSQPAKKSCYEELKVLSDEAPENLGSLPAREALYSFEPIEPLSAQTYSSLLRMRANSSESDSLHKSKEHEFSNLDENSPMSQAVLKSKEPAEFEV